MPRGRGCCSTSGLFDRQYGEGKPRALAQPVALRPDAAPVRLHDPLTDGQAQTRTADFAFPGLAVDPGKLPEQVRQPLGGDPGALVGDGDRHVGIFPHRGHPDDRRLQRVPCRIGQEVGQDLDNALSVCHDRGQIQREVEVEGVPAAAA